MLIFHSFPDQPAAARFMLAVGMIEPELECTPYLDAEKAAEAASFPYLLTTPVVLVARPDSSHDAAILEVREIGGGAEPLTAEERESALEALATVHGGQFAGT